MEDVVGFVKRDGKRIVNGNGKEILLRGVGFGGWMLPEGYMWCFPEQGDRPRRIEKMIRELVGSEKAAEFWSLYHQNYIAEVDIKRVIEEGFNSVRLPINSRNILEGSEGVHFNEENMHYVDRVIEWCRKYGLYVILDLHGAPGGQTGANIDDSENDIPELFTDEKNRKRTVELWKSLASRYKDEYIIAGYDLLNEPLPDWNAVYNPMVMPLYKEIIEAIRQVDKQHMIILEGVHWATDWSIFTELPDDNVMLQFHKYWNNPDTESIQKYLDKRTELNVPILMGESGENNTDWYAGAFKSFEDHNISWNFWPWKKMDTTNSPFSVNRPAHWDYVVNYLKGGEKPDRETSEKILWEYLNNLCLEKCEYRSEVSNSLFRRVPVRIPAIFYGYKGREVDFRVSKASSDNAGFRINDGVPFYFVEGTRETVNFAHGEGAKWASDEWLSIQLEHGDWVAYDFNVRSADSDFVTIHGMVCAIEGDSCIDITIDGEMSRRLEVHTDLYKEIKLAEGIKLGQGTHRIILKAEGKPLRLEWINID